MPVVGNLNFAILDPYWATSYQSIAFRPNRHRERGRGMVSWLYSLSAVLECSCMHPCFTCEVVHTVMVTSKATKQTSLYFKEL